MSDDPQGTIQTGHGCRGCKPHEFLLYDPLLIYLKCQVCNFEWVIHLSEFFIKQPTICPVCHETWLFGNYIKHNMQFYETRIVYGLPNRKLDIKVSSPDIIFGEPGLYSVDIYPLNKPNATQPEFSKLVFFEDPINLQNNPHYNKSALVVFIEEDRAWKRARIYNYRVVNAIQD